MASIAARVEMGEAQDSGVARSSRAGINRKVKAGPTTRFWPGLNGLVPRSQTLRRPFLCSTVVSVAVVMPESASIVFSSSPIVMWPAEGRFLNVACCFLDAGDQAAVYADYGTGEVGGALAGEEGDYVGVLFRLAVAAEWNRGRALR